MFISPTINPVAPGSRTVLKDIYHGIWRVLPLLTYLALQLLTQVSSIRGLENHAPL